MFGASEGCRRAKMTRKQEYRDHLEDEHDGRIEAGGGGGWIRESKVMPGSSKRSGNFLGNKRTVDRGLVLSQRGGEETIVLPSDSLVPDFPLRSLRSPRTEMYQRAARIITNHDS